MERPQDIPPCDSRVVESGIRGAVCTLRMKGCGVEQCAIRAPAPVALAFVCLCFMTWERPICCVDWYSDWVLRLFRAFA